MPMISLLDHRGRPIGEKKSLNLDPLFFSTSSGGSIGEVTSSQIESQPYSYHAWIHACASVISRNVSNLPIILRKIDTKEKVDDKYGVIRLINRPNPIMTRTTFIEHIVLNLLLAGKNSGTGGQCFIIPKVTKKGKSIKCDLSQSIPDVLLPIPGNRLIPIKTSDSWSQLKGWELDYTSSGQEKEIYYKNDLIRIYFVNPYDWLSGLSKYTPSLLALLQDVKSDLYNTKILDNDATPSGILSSEAMLSSDQRKDVMQSWAEEFSGSKNSRKTAVLSKGMTFQRIALSQEDMQFSDMKNDSVERIIACFGLNKIALGMYENVNYATIVEGRKMLWQDTYLPIGNRILEAINSQWIYYLDETIECAFDISGIESLQVSYKDKIASAAQMVRDMRVPAFYAMQLNGIPVTDQDKIDYPWLNTEPTTPNSYYSMPSDASGDSGKSSAVDQKKSIVSKSMKKFDRENFSLEYITKTLKPGEKTFRSAIDRFFISQRNAILDKIDIWLSQYKSIVSKTIDFTGLNLGDVLLSISEENNALFKLLRPIYRDQIKRAGLKIKSEIDTIRWGVTDPLISKFTDARKVSIESVNTTTMKLVGEKINDTISTVRAEGGTVLEAAKAIKLAVRDTMDMRASQAETIAITEIGIITSETRYDAFKTEGVESQEWVTSHDDRVRDTHAAADGEIVKIGDYFKIGDDNLLHPLDPNGSAGEIINCRCVAIAVIPDLGDE
jgi:SPP1 gp7 family putative phage head morphogenesis protein